MKTSELSGVQLDWAVAKAEGYPDEDILIDYLNYSTDWAQGGQIIERERIDILFQEKNQWLAVGLGMCEAQGTTPLIAAMRCYVASKLGDEIDLPVEIRSHEQDCPAVDGFGCKCGEGG